jgi:hypothetical protein
MLLSGLLLFIYLNFFVFAFGNIFIPTFSGTQLGRKIRPWCMLLCAYRVLEIRGPTQKKRD